MAIAPVGSSIVGVDPGSRRSAWVLLRRTEAGAFVEEHGLEDNEAVLDRLRWGAVPVAVEWTQPRGMPASADLFESLWWAGRFREVAGARAVRVLRSAVKRHLCGTTAAKDQNVMAALTDRFGGVGGRSAAVGRKAEPGPLYGVTLDRWAALAVAVTYLDLGEMATFDPASLESPRGS